MNEHPYELLRLARLKSRQYQREAEQYSHCPKGRVRRRLAFMLRNMAERLEPETVPTFASFERGV